MANDSFEMEEQAEQHTSYKKQLMFVVGAIILTAVGFCEILYVFMLLPAFPDGLVRLIAIAGACATGASAIALLVGKLHWFSKGPQTTAAWAFVGVETLILALNVLLAVQLHNGHVADWLQFWEGFYPAAPIVAFVGWGVILFLDRDNAVRAFQREQADKQQTAEIEFQAMVHRAKMKVKHQSLNIISGYLEETMESQPNLLALRKTADQIYDTLLSGISGQHISSRIPRSKGVVEGTVSLPQTDSIASPAQDAQPPVYEQPVMQRPPDTVESLRNDLQESIRTTSGMQNAFADYMRKTGKTDDEIEAEMSAFFDEVNKRRNAKKP